MGRDGLFEDAENLVFADDENLLPIDFDFRSGIFSEQDLIAGLDLRRNAVTGIEHFARADRDYFAALGFFLRAIRNVEASEFRFVFFDAPDDDSIVEGTNCHISYQERSTAEVLECCLALTRSVRGGNLCSSINHEYFDALAAAFDIEAELFVQRSSPEGE